MVRGVRSNNHALAESHPLFKLKMIHRTHAQVHEFTSFCSLKRPLCLCFHANVLITLVLMDCAAAPPAIGPGPSEVTQAPALPGEITDSRAADSALAARFPEEIAALAATSTPRDEKGLVGRNRSWGAMYSARFQLGTGYALRMAVANNDAARATLALAGIKAALSTQEASGRLPSSVPMAAQLNRGDLASAAAFFLGDACLGVLALEHSGLRDTIAGARRDEVRRRLAGAIDWLTGEALVLQQADAAAPNRLLFDARSYGACGALSSNEAARALSAQFTDAALALQRPDGVFVEGGGADTSYQSVGLDIGSDVLHHLDPERRARTSAALLAGAKWLSTRVCTGGQVDSSGNTRTCGGGETFLNEPKLYSVTSGFDALAKLGLFAGDEVLMQQAASLARWARENAGTDSCFTACP